VRAFHGLAVPVGERGGQGGVVLKLELLGQRRRPVGAGALRDDEEEPLAWTISLTPTTWMPRS